MIFLKEENENNTGNFEDNINNIPLNERYIFQEDTSDSHETLITKIALLLTSCDKTEEFLKSCLDYMISFFKPKKIAFIKRASNSFETICKWAENSDFFDIDSKISNSLSEKISEIESTPLNSQSKSFIVDSTIISILTSNGNICGFLIVDENTTDEKRIEEDRKTIEKISEIISKTITKIEKYEKLTRTEELYRILIETAKDYILIHDLEGNIEFFNESGLKMSGYTMDELKERKIIDIIPSSLKNEVKSRFFQRVKGDEKRSIYETAFINKKGKTIPLETCSSLFKLPGQDYKVLIIARNIEQRRETEKKLRESEERYALAFEGANDGLWDWDIRKNKLTVSSRLKKLLGYDYSKIDTIEDFYRLTVPTETENIYKELNRHLKGLTEHYHQEIQLKNSKGDYKWFLMRGKALYDTEGKAFRMCGSLTDINSRKKMEQQLRASELKYKSLLEIQSDLIIRIDTNGKLVYVNDIFCSTFNISRDQAIGKSIFEFEFDEDAGMGKERLEYLSTKPVDLSKFENFECRMNTREGTLWFSWECSIIRDLNNNILIIQCVGRNIEELKKAQREAEMANKAKSEFLANMSHEIRTPMNGILGMLRLLRNTSDENEKTEYIDAAILSGKRLIKLLNEILDISKIEANKIAVENKIFNLENLLKSVISTFKKQCDSKGIKILYEISDDVAEEYISDPNKISQIFFNLVSNSFKFTETGSIKINVKKFANPVENYLKQRKDSIEYEKLLFSVKDTGIGIPEDYLDEIFMSFKQLNIQKKYLGTGLGLAIVKQLVSLLNGNVSVESMENRGSVFSVLLPLKTISQSMHDKRNFFLVYSDSFEEKIIKAAFEKNKMKIKKSISLNEYLKTYKNIKERNLFICCEDNLNTVFKTVKKFDNSNYDYRIFILTDKNSDISTDMYDHRNLKILTRPFDFDISLFNS